MEPTSASRQPTDLPTYRILVAGELATIVCCTCQSNGLVHRFHPAPIEDVPALLALHSNGARHYRRTDSPLPFIDLTA